jgi:hypothetical protein
MNLGFRKFKEGVGSASIIQGSLQKVPHLALPVIF